MDAQLRACPGSGSGLGLGLGIGIGIGIGLGLGLGLGIGVGLDAQLRAAQHEPLGPEQHLPYIDAEKVAPVQCGECQYTCCQYLESASKLLATAMLAMIAAPACRGWG